MMDKVQRFELRRSENTRGNYFELVVDGRPYLSVLAEFERSFAGAIAGSYQAGLELTQLESGSKGAVPYICECPDPDCWFIRVEISRVASAGEDYVVWHNWHNPYRNDKARASEGLYWDYSALPPLVFDEQQYQAEIDRHINGTQTAHTA